jgi:hypothetical protein
MIVSNFADTLEERVEAFKCVFFNAMQVPKLLRCNARN